MKSHTTTQESLLRSCSGCARRSGTTTAPNTNVLHSFSRSARSVLVIAGALGVLLAGALAPTAHADEVQLSGKVKRKPEATGFDLRTKKGMCKVVITDETEVVVHRTEALHKAAKGDRPWVLGQIDWALPAEIFQIHAVVADRDGCFTPTRIPKGLPVRVSWHEGSIKNNLDRATRCAISVPGGATPPLLRCRTTQQILTIKRGRAEDVKKKASVLVEGVLEGEGKARTIRAKKITLLAPRFSAKTYRLILGS